jgi:hypothetical protein
MRWPFEDYLARMVRKMLGPKIRELLARRAQMTPAHYESLLATAVTLQRPLRAVLARCDGFITLACFGTRPAASASRGAALSVLRVVAGLPAFSLPLLERDTVCRWCAADRPLGADSTLCSSVRWIDGAGESRYNGSLNGGTG